ncbi:MAG TPA: hypothetical protein VGY54_23705 [Polyangiaceae bacterium]|nr:hypothetical protein [Polyangiaceae bacterium]
MTACSTDNGATPGHDAGPDSSTDSGLTDSSGNNGLDAGSCTNPGMAGQGAADTHCLGSDGGLMVTQVMPATCDAAVGDDGGGGCPYGDTMDGLAGDDDDCKYHVTWSSTPICRGSAPVIFTVKVTYLGTPNMPLAGAATAAEVFTTTPLDAGGDAGYCDNQSSHIDPLNLFHAMTEGPAGTYTGPIYFDQPGQWTVRFHFNENCNDVPESPHGHAAFHVTVP